MILAGDIGGTKTNLALFDDASQSNTPVLEGTFSSREHGSLEEIVEKFLTRADRKIAAACFGVAGPVQDGRAEATNLPWVVNARDLGLRLGSAPVSLINDLEANAYGIGALSSEDFAVLQDGAPAARGHAAVISAGTGLGEAGLYWDGHDHHPFASEGGHADFAPRSELEMELLRFLQARYGHVSYERVLSGPGLQNIYEFLRESGRGEEPAWLAAEMRLTDPSAAISQAALRGRSELSVQALDLFVSVYGAEAGNLALRILARGGVFVGGGIAPKILAKLESGTFMESFLSKGRLRSVLEAVPVRVILNEKTALFGAARRARAGIETG